MRNALGLPLQEDTEALVLEQGEMETCVVFLLLPKLAFFGLSWEKEEVAYCRARVLLFSHRFRSFK